MGVRRLAPIVLVLALAACSSPKPVPEMRTDTLPTQLPPAELPTYAKGDRYTYDNPREDWTIVGLHDGLVSWESSLGETRTTMFDPLLPPIGWKKADESEGTRQILEWSGGMFPLKAGNKLTFKTAVQVKGESGHALFIWNCYAGNPRMIEVPAGAFAAVPVYCRRSDGNKLHTFYAPALNNAVSLELATPDGKQTTRNLIAFEPGKGPRIAAPRVESLPGGWSAAAIATWSQEAAGLPRVRPETVATANPPVGLATPTDQSRSADEVPRRDEKSTERTILALHAPVISPPPPTAAETAPTPTPQPQKAATGAMTRYGAHIGSYKSRESAERGWAVFGKKLPVIRETARHTVYTIDLGPPKGLMYRLVAGPTPSKADAIKLCATVKEEGGYCRVVAFKS
jgi:cell division septation protein DedD